MRGVAPRLPLALGCLLLIAQATRAEPPATPRAAPAQAHRYVLATASQAQAEIADMAGAERSGDIVQIPVDLLRREPVRLQGLEIYWAQGFEQIDCAAHRGRLKLVATLTLDRTQRRVQPAAEFKPWLPVRPNTAAAALEAFACRGQQGSIRSVASLAEFQHAYIGDVALANPPGPPFPYYVISTDEIDAMLIDMAHRTKAGDVVRTSMLGLTVKPSDPPGPDYNWIEFSVEYDCAQHRWRDGIRAALPLDRARRQENPDFKFGAWEAAKPKSPAGDAEALVCRGDPGKDPFGVTNLGEFQRQFFAYIKSLEPASGHH